MNLMGMGLAEIAVVMVVAFLVLGPNRAINLARTAGKLMGDLRRTFNEVASAISMEERGQASSPRESRPADQSQSSQDGTGPGDVAPVVFVPEGSGPEALDRTALELEASGLNASEHGSLGATEPNRPAPSKNGDE